MTHPLVNILRGAMSFLVAIVSHPLTSSNRASQTSPFGFEALRPAITAHPEFLEMLVTRLSSADHALCANSLQLINALMRDSITKGLENEWPRFIKRLQDLGVIKAVFVRTMAEHVNCSDSLPCLRLSSSAKRELLMQHEK